MAFPFAPRYAAGPLSPADRRRLLDAAGLDEPAFGLLAALFDADGASPDALGARVHAPREVVDGLLGRLVRLGFVEQDGEAAWLTGPAFGLRRAVGRLTLPGNVN